MGTVHSAFRKVKNKQKRKKNTRGVVQTKGEQQENGTIGEKRKSNKTGEKIIIKTNQNQYKTHLWFTNIIIWIKDKRYDWVKIEINVWSGPLLYYNNQNDINSGFKAVSRWISIAYFNRKYFGVQFAERATDHKAMIFPSAMLTTRTF